MKIRQGPLSNCYFQLIYVSPSIFTYLLLFRKVTRWYAILMLCDFYIFIKSIKLQTNKKYKSLYAICLNIENILYFPDGLKKIFILNFCFFRNRGYLSDKQSNWKQLWMFLLSFLYKSGQNDLVISIGLISSLNRCFVASSGVSKISNAILKSN